MTPEKLAPGEAGQRVEEAMDRLSILVTCHGPEPLTRGMPAYLAHERMVACIERLAGLAGLPVLPHDIQHLITEYLTADPSYALAKAICSELNNRMVKP